MKRHWLPLIVTVVAVLFVWTVTYAAGGVTAMIDSIGNLSILVWGAVGAIIGFAVAAGFSIYERSKRY